MLFFHHQYWNLAVLHFLKIQYLSTTYGETESREAPSGKLSGPPESIISQERKTWNHPAATTKELLNAVSCSCSSLTSQVNQDIVILESKNTKTLHPWWNNIFNQEMYSLVPLKIWTYPVLWSVEMEIAQRSWDSQVWPGNQRFQLVLGDLPQILVVNIVFLDPEKHYFSRSIASKDPEKQMGGKNPELQWSCDVVGG